ncbi:MAG: hypothetical protein U1A78_25960 [Polyangia bacterium]
MNENRYVNAGSDTHGRSLQRRRLWLALALWAASGCSGAMERGADLGTSGDQGSGSDQGSSADLRSGPSGPGLALIAGLPGGAGRVDATGTAARFYNAYRLAPDGASGFYVSDISGAIRRVDASTAQVTTVAQVNNLRALAADGAGNIYFTTNPLFQVRKLNVASGQVSVLVDSSANLYGSEAIVWDGGANLYLADTSSSTIRKVVIATGALTTIAGTAGTVGSTDGTGTAALFDHPNGLAYDAGSLYVSDRSNVTIRKIDLATSAVTTIAGTAKVPGNSDGIGAAARFNLLNDVAADHAGSLYVADGYRVRRLDLSTGAVTSIAGQVGRTGSADGVGSAALFSLVQGLGVDAAGNVLVADVTTIRKLTRATNNVVTYAGQFARPGNTDGVGNLASFRAPVGPLAWDGAGNLYVPDTGNVSVRRIVLSTGQVSTLAGGVPGTTDGIGAAARFSKPSGLAWDGTGSLFVSDSNRLRRVVVATGEVTTLAGDVSGNLDGIGTAARFSTLGGLTYDGAGSLYVADTGNSAIRKVVIATGQVTTLLSGFNAVSDLAYDGAGNLYAAQGTGSGLYRISTTTGMSTFMTSSQLANHLVVGVIADGAGSLYVSHAALTPDQPGTVLRKITLATDTVTTVAGSLTQQGVLLGPFPGALNLPRGLCWIPNQGLALSDITENVVLLARGL